MKYIGEVLNVLMISFVLFSSCNKPTPIGEELLQQDQAEVFASDTFSFTAKTVEEGVVKTFDPALTIDPDLSFGFYLCGDFSDPIFGDVIANVYTQARLKDNFTPPSSRDEPLTFDSLMLVLAFDSLYGDYSQPFELNIKRLDEDMFNDQVYYSDQSFSSISPAIGNITFVPADLMVVDYIDSSRVDENNETIYEEILKMNPLHISLSEIVGTELMEYDSLTYDNSQAFVDQFKGIHIEPALNNEGILNFDFNSIDTRMTLYYKHDTSHASYPFFFSASNASASVVNFEHNFSSTIDNAVSGGISGDSLLFIQGMAGTNISLDFKHLDDLKNTIINRAELVFVIKDDFEDDNIALYPPPVQIVAVTENGDVPFWIDDAIPTSSNNFSYFNGQIEEMEIDGNTVKVYRMNISTHFQDMINGVESSNLTLRITGKSQRANRAILYGPGHSKYPAMLNITYTKL